MAGSQEQELLTVAEVAKRLSVSTRTVIQWAHEGRIPEIRPSPRIRRYDWLAVVRALSAASSGR